MAKNIKTDVAWDNLFKRYAILEQVRKMGSFEITADQIREEKEPRLMAKFDHKEQLPKVFRDNHLSILPTKRGNYVIGEFATHKEIIYDDEVPFHKIKDRSDLESLRVNDLYSEAVSLNYALATGMIKDMIGETAELTISGRMKSSDFSFKVKNAKSGNAYEIDVNNALIEIDGGYETEHKLILIEAKKGKCDDFIIRQLYYPYRLWKGKINKDVIPVFMTQYNGVFSFFIFKFDDDDDYNSIKLVKQVNYTVDFEPITKQDIKKIDSIKYVEEPDTPFPQANDFDKCINFLEFLKDGERLKNEFADEYPIVERQVDYYKNADKYLGLVADLPRQYVKLTALGEKIINMPRKERNVELIKLILSHKTFNESYEIFKKEGDISTENIVNIMKNNKLKNMTGTTIPRRASSIKGRCDRIKRTIDEKLASN